VFACCKAENSHLNHYDCREDKPVAPHCSTQDPRGGVGSSGFRDQEVELGRFRVGFRDQGWSWVGLGVGLGIRVQS